MKIVSNKNKRGMELQISTLILIALGIILLIVIVYLLTDGFKKFKRGIDDVSGAEIDNLKRICDLQCKSESEYSFCCQERELGDEIVTCQDERLDLDCEIDCQGCEDV